MRRGSAVLARVKSVPARRAALTLCVVAVASLGAAAAATATTGPGYLLKHPGYKVTNKAAAPFIGIWKFDPAGHSSNLINASMFANFGERPENFLVGQVQVYSYANNGEEGDWVGTMYNWHWTGKEMQMELVGFGGSPVLGYMTLTSAGPNHLVGTVVTRAGNSHYKMQFTKTKIKPQPVGN
jgi:hypothetical protein